jgi:hypothetical protein
VACPTCPVPRLWKAVRSLRWCASQVRGVSGNGVGVLPDGRPDRLLFPGHPPPSTWGQRVGMPSRISLNGGSEIGRPSWSPSAVFLSARRLHSAWRGWPLPNTLPGATKASGCPTQARRPASPWSFLTRAAPGRARAPASRTRPRQSPPVQPAPPPRNPAGLSPSIDSRHSDRMGGEKCTSYDPRKAEGLAWPEAHEKSVWVAERLTNADRRVSPPFANTGRLRGSGRSRGP